MKPRILKSIPQHTPRERDGMSEKHTQLVAKLCCLGCGASPFIDPTVVPHHLLRTGEHGMGIKSTDKWCVPLCHACHGPGVPGSLHELADEDAWFSARNIDARAVARALWRNTGDLKAMNRVIDRARQAARSVRHPTEAERESGDKGS